MADKEDGRSKLDTFEEGSENEDEEEGSEEGSEEDEDSEPPPPMLDSSGSEAGFEETVPPKKGNNEKNADGRWTKPSSKASGASSAGDTGAIPKSKQAAAAKPAAAKPAATRRGVNGAKAESEPPAIWTAFAKYRSGLTEIDRLGFVAFKKWEAFEKEGSIPAAFLAWYTDQVKGNRSVPQALMVPKLTSGFPEFCHWVADGHYKPSVGTLKTGFHSMARDHVSKVKVAEGGGVTAPSRTVAANKTSANGTAAVAVVARNAPASEPIGGASSAFTGAGTNTNTNNQDPKSRKRERRMNRKGAMGGANGVMFAEKMQSALANLQLIDEGGGDDAKGQGKGHSAAGRAMRTGSRAEEELLEAMRQSTGQGVEDDMDAGDALGAAFADTTLPEGSRVMLGGLRRARTYRKRADRQFELLEGELERCLARMARVEAQYHALVAETSGRDSSLEVALSSALPLVKEATGQVDGGRSAQALEVYSNAITLLEVHVDQSARGGRESEEAARARETLGLALCNRSIANFLVGNNYNGKVDAVRGADVWKSPNALQHLERSVALVDQEGASRPPPEWKAFPVP